MHPTETCNSNKFSFISPHRPTQFVVYTGCSLVAGDLAYSAPEVLATFVNPVVDSTITPAADIWGIACVLYKILTGSRLFGPPAHKHCEDEQAISSDAEGHAESLLDDTSSHAGSDEEPCPMILLIQDQQRALVSLPTIQLHVWLHNPLLFV